MLFVTSDDKAFWHKSEVYFWYSEGTPFKTWKVGIFISECFKSRFSVKTWALIVSLTLIICVEWHSAVLWCSCVFEAKKNAIWSMSPGTEILSLTIVAALEMWRLFPLCSSTFLSAGCALQSLLFRVSSSVLLCTTIPHGEHLRRLGLDSITPRTDTSQAGSPAARTAFVNIETPEEHRQHLRSFSSFPS